MRNIRTTLTIAGLAALLAGCGGGNTSQISRQQQVKGLTRAGSNFARVARTILNPGEGHLYAGVIDSQAGYGYFATTGNSYPAYIIKVALGVGDSAPVRIGSIALPVGEDHITSAVIDPANGYAYFGTATSPGKVIKIALGIGNALPKRVGSIAMQSGESCLWSAVLDPASGYAYFGSAGTTARVIKVAVGTGSALPRRISALNLPAGIIPKRAVIDTPNGYAYFVGPTACSVLAKVALSQGTAAPTLASTLTMLRGEDSINFAEIDAAAGYAYLGTYSPGGAYDDTTPGKIIKVRLNAGSAAPERIGCIITPPKFWSAGVLDLNRHFLYVGNDLTWPASNVIQVDVGSGDSLPQLAASIQLNPGSAGYTFATQPPSSLATPDGAGEVYIQSAILDAANGYAYFGTDTVPGQIVKVSIPSG